MKFYSLASGSNGNSFLIDNGKQTILIDVGISFNKIKEKLDLLGYDILNVDYILITHAHVDHIKSLNSFSCSSVKFLAFIFLTATFCPLYVPTKTIPKAPSPIAGI